MFDFQLAQDGYTHTGNPDYTWMTENIEVGSKRELRELVKEQTKLFYNHRVAHNLDGKSYSTYLGWMRAEGSYQRDQAYLCLIQDIEIG